MWPERTKPRTEGFIRPWLHVLPFLGSMPEGDRRWKSRAEAHKRKGKGGATAEHWCCACYSWAHQCLYPEAFCSSRASSLFCSSLFSLSSLFICPTPLISSHSPASLISLFLFHLWYFFTSLLTCLSCLPFSHCQMALSKAYANLYSLQHLSAYTCFFIFS